MKIITTPFTKAQARSLRAGEEVLLDGTVYTARDQAHARLAALVVQRKPLPFALHNSVFYYCGPNPAPPGKVIGSCGPTTAGRMDTFTPVLMRKGLRGMIGKGERTPAVTAAIKRFQGIYFVTYAGCGALLAQSVRKRELVAFPELGAEAVYALTVRGFPLVVAIDAR